MLSFLTLIAVLLVVWLGAVVVVGYFSGKSDLISWRNFFLLGFFQFYALAVVIMAPLEFPSHIYRPQGHGYLLLAIAMPLFLGLFFLGNRWARDWTWPDRYVPKLDLPVTNIALLIAVAVISALVIVSIGLTGRGYQEGIIYFVRPGLACVASGLAFYLLLSSPKNPLYWAVFIPVFLMAVILATVGTIDRRNFLGVFFVIPWIWYYARLRYQRPRKVLTRIGIAAAITFVALVIYNSGRHAFGWQGSFKDRANQLVELAQRPDFSSRNILQELLFQDTPLNTLAVLENYPEQFDYMPLHGLHFYLVNPIPRSMYPSKPEGMGTVLQRQLGVYDANLGVGIIGSGWSEASWIGVAYYALGFGVLTAIIDGLARARAHNPFFLATVGGSLGNVLGLARGETSLFMVMITVVALTSCLALWLLGVVFRPYMLAGRNVQMLPPAEAPVDDVPDEVPAYDDDLVPVERPTQAA